MAIMDKFAPLGARRQALAGAGADPFSVAFEESLSPVEAVVNGRRTLLFGTNNYLGLTFDADAVQAAAEAVRTLGTGTTGSRIANGSYGAHRDLETDLADFYGTKHCMVFSTGYQANLAMISTLVGKDDHLVIDADSHASIYDASRLGHAPVIRFRHNSPEDLDKRLARLKGQPGDRLVVVEGIYSMLGDTSPIREIAAVKREHGAYLLVDEAHSMGVLGRTGRGLAEAAGVEDDVDFTVGTFSKSLGSVGGFCTSDVEGFDILRLAARPYMFTASLPPSVMASTRAALASLRAKPQLRDRLAANSRRYYDGLAARGFKVGPTCTPIVAIEVGDPALGAAFWAMLLDAGIYLNLALPPATPTPAALLRSSVSAAHSDAQIDAAIDAIASIGTELGVLAAPRAPVVAEAPEALAA